MQYANFKQIFNETIFERSKADLLKKIADNPSRYIGLFRPTKPKAKILQNLLQSHEIRFGDAFEHIIESYLSIKGCEILPKDFKYGDDSLNIDQCFRKENTVYFIEQKIRDDHDSTKKRGQIINFEKKLEVMIEQYGERNLVGIFYFIDPELQKNKNFYADELVRISTAWGVDTKLFYGSSLFEYLNFSDVWYEILSYLEIWKREIPDLPEINFDLDAENTFEEIRDLGAATFRKLLRDDNILDEIILVLFPEKTTLRLLLDYFNSRPETIYRNLSERIERFLQVF
jgi:hypothetical protein